MHTQDASKPRSASDEEAQTRQFLTFLLAGEEYAIPILRVQEIRGRTSVTPIPNTPHDLLGVVNLRGDIVPVLDLRRTFGLPAPDDDGKSVTVMIMLGDRVLGLEVDAVSDVIDLAEGDTSPMPELAADRRTFLTGMARRDERLVHLLDVDRIVAERGPSTGGDDT